MPFHRLGRFVMSFKDSLRNGFIGESIITKWLNTNGYDVLPAYEIGESIGKGPRLFTATQGQLITPDLLVFKDGDVCCWVEAKTKSAFTWHRKTKSFQTGIDLKYWNDYLKVREQIKFNLNLFFLHKEGNAAKDTPSGEKSPSGLYFGEINDLRETIDHEHPNCGSSGMVYWQEKDLTKLCDYEDVLKLSI